MEPNPTLTKDEQRLLGNALDALDRVFDNESLVIDLQALLFVTAKALPESECRSVMETAAQELLEIVRRTSRTTELQRRDAALEATDSLRHLLARLLAPFEKISKPDLR